MVSPSVLKCRKLAHSQQSTLEAIESCEPEAATRYNYHATPLRRDAKSDKKIYCTYWIRHGECDYIQQGCRYKHEMPDLKTLKSIGFQGVPRWYRERISMAAAHPMRSRGEFRRMIEAFAHGSSISSISDSSSASGSDVSSSNAMPSRHRPLVPTSVSTLPTKPASDMPMSPRTLTHGHPNALESQKSTEETVDRAHEDSITDLETSSQNSLLVPNNSPELPTFRRGRFVPANELFAARTKSKISSAVFLPSPAITPTSCPSPLVLGSPVSRTAAASAAPTAPFSAVPNSAQLPVPKSMHYFSPEQVAISTSVPSNSETATTFPSAPSKLNPKTNEQISLENKMEVLKAKMEALKQQQQATSSKYLAPNIAAQSLTHNEPMTSRYRTNESDGTVQESKENAVKQKKSESGPSRFQAEQTGSQIRRRKGTTQVLAQARKDDDMMVTCEKSASQSKE
jgi:hypothetical protein